MDWAVLHEEHHVRVDIDDDGIALVTLDRPKSRNAVNAAMHRGLELAFHELSMHPDVRVIVVTGEGKGFCAGGDMKDYGGPGTAVSTLRNRELNWAMARCEAPTISAVNGAARGIGATIALLCDVCYMAESATIADTHVDFGFMAGDGGQVIWPLQIGPNLAKEFLMRGTVLTGAEAYRVGLINRVVPDDRLLDEAMECARDIARRPASAVRWTKLAINKLIVNQLNLTLDFGLASEALADLDPEVLEQRKQRRKSL